MRFMPFLILFMAWVLPGHASPPVDDMISEALEQRAWVQLHHILPEANSEQRARLALKLRRIKPADPVIFSLLLETNRATKKDVVRWFSLTSSQFARVIYRVQQGGSLPASLAPEQPLVAEQLERVARALQNGDFWTEAAFDQAFEEAGFAKPNDYRARDRLLFFELLYSGRLQWLDRGSWITAVKADDPEWNDLKSRYQITGNLIRVNFGGCGRLLE
jgi:hypothetical protein